MHLPPFNTPSSDNAMYHPPIEDLGLQSRERLPVPAGGAIPGSDETEGQRLLDTLMRRALIDTQKAEISRLSSWKERYARKYRSAKDRIAELDQQLEERSRTDKEAAAKREQRIKTLEDELTQTKELLAARAVTTEHSETQPLLPTTDRLSDAEVLGTVRDLNETIFQLAANLTEEWEQFTSSQSNRFTTTKENSDSFSQSYSPAFIHQVLNRKPTAVTFLIQSCLCELATQTTSSWRRNEELRALKSVYQRLSPSEAQVLLTRWKSLIRGPPSEPSSHSTLITQRVAQALSVTGSFPSTQQSSDFVKAKASKGIETINRLALRLESAFMMDIAHGDTWLLFEGPRTVFDDTRMTKEFESDEPSAHRRQDKVAATTEVGVEKSVCGLRGEGRRTEILLKAKVVLEKDLADL